MRFPPTRCAIGKRRNWLRLAKSVIQDCARCFTPLNRARSTNTSSAPGFDQSRPLLADNAGCRQKDVRRAVEFFERILFQSFLSPSHWYDADGIPPAFERLNIFAPMKRLQNFSVAVILFLLPTISVFAQENGNPIFLSSGHGKDGRCAVEIFLHQRRAIRLLDKIRASCRSNWELHGFGTLPNYHRDLTNAYVERGLYEHDFFVQENWSGKRIFLVFDGAMTDTSVKLNDQSVGPIHHRRVLSLHKYEVTSLLKFGATNKPSGS